MKPAPDSVPRVVKFSTPLIGTSSIYGSRSNVCAEPWGLSQARYAKLIGINARVLHRFRARLGILHWVRFKPWESRSASRLRSFAGGDDACARWAIPRFLTAFRSPARGRAYVTSMGDLTAGPKLPTPLESVRADLGSEALPEERRTSACALIRAAGDANGATREKRHRHPHRGSRTLCAVAAEVRRRRRRAPRSARVFRVAASPGRNDRHRRQVVVVAAKVEAKLPGPGCTAMLARPSRLPALDAPSLDRLVASPDAGVRCLFSRVAPLASPAARNSARTRSFGRSSGSASEPQVGAQLSSGVGKFGPWVNRP